MNSHDFCRRLWTMTRKEHGLRECEVSQVKSSLGGYFVQFRGYSADVRGCCAWSAKVHGIEAILERNKTNNDSDGKCVPTSGTMPVSE